MSRSMVCTPVLPRHQETVRSREGKATHVTILSETQRRARGGNASRVTAANPLFSRKASARQERKEEPPQLDREGEAEGEAERERAKLRAFFDGGELGEVRRQNGRKQKTWPPSAPNHFFFYARTGIF